MNPLHLEIRRLDKHKYVKENKIDKDIGNAKEKYADSHDTEKQYSALFVLSN